MFANHIPWQSANVASFMLRWTLISLKSSGRMENIGFLIKPYVKLLARVDRRKKIIASWAELLRYYRIALMLDTGS